MEQNYHHKKERKMLNKFGLLIFTILIGCIIFVITSIIKFEVLGRDYSQFLTDAYDYNSQILITMDLLEKEGFLEEAIECGLQHIDADLINTTWYFDIFDWTEDSFATPEILEKLNYWRETGKIPETKKSQTDYQKGIQSV